MQVVITAGGRIGGEFAESIGTRVKALAPLNGSTMLARTIAACETLGATRIAAIGGDEVRTACGDSVDEVIAESERGSQNVLAALRSWNEREPLLYLTSDMPFVTPAALRDFIERVPDGVLAMAVSEELDFAARFPGAPPHGVTLAGERIVNGGAFVLPPGARRRVESAATTFFNARKSLVRMAVLLGPALLFQFVTRRLSIAKLEAHAERILGIPARAVRGCAPELAFDVDTFEEYRYACSLA
jgi:GTP:adenosylcobinamide-phosphate guanylyltransferase